MTANQLIEILKTLPPDTIINVPTEYGYSPDPIKTIYRADHTPGVILSNEISDFADIIWSAA